MHSYPELIEVPSGLFAMGSKQDSLYSSANETPEHRKHVPTFYLAKYPVTNQEYASFIRATSHSFPAYWNSSVPPENKLEHPVVEVDFDDAIAYCKWLSDLTGHTFRLPREEEWEKAARGTADSRIYTWGDDWISINCNSSEDGYQNTTSVRHYRNVQENFYGIADLLGNVWEWVDSYFIPYPNNIFADLEYKIEKRIVRGGSYMNDRNSCRISKRGRYDASTKRPYLGFRIASDSQPTIKKSASSYSNMYLRELLEEYFGLADLNTLAFDLGFKIDNFNQKPEIMARELIEVCKNRGRIEELIKYIKQARPHINWEEGAS